MEYLSRSRWDLWPCVCNAAVAFQHLHSRGIIHSDLKGNNVLVGTNRRVKLADFGDISEAQAAKKLAASSWKAPEVLHGEPSTTASDVFSFSMCIIEVVSGAPPWGNDLGDAVVKYQVKRGELPLRPVGFRDDEWQLITRMNCFNSGDRVAMAETVEVLNNFRERKPLN